MHYQKVIAFFGRKSTISGSIVPQALFDLPKVPTFSR